MLNNRQVRPLSKLLDKYLKSLFFSLKPKISPNYHLQMLCFQGFNFNDSDLCWMLGLLSIMDGTKSFKHWEKKPRVGLFLSLS